MTRFPTTKKYSTLLMSDPCFALTSKMPSPSGLEYGLSLIHILPGRVVFYCDEFGTMPAFDVEALFSAGRSRGITLVHIIQSLAQLEKN